MTTREYAARVNFPVIGKLKREYEKVIIYDYIKGKDVVCKRPYYIDEAGNEYLPSKRSDGTTGWCIVDAEGGVL